MNNTKLGINEYLFAALVFLAAIMGPVPLLGLIIFAVLVEKSEIILSNGKLALIIVACKYLVNAVLDFLEYIVRTFASSDNNDVYKYYGVLNRFSYFVECAFIVAMIVLIVINVLKSRSGSTANVVAPAAQTPVQPAAPAQAAAPVQPAAPVQAAAPAQPAAPAQDAAPKTAAVDGKCPKCGRNVAPGTVFCPGCGTKLQ